jgi:trehalose synthase
LRDAAGARNARWIWRCHIDTSSPNSEVAAFLLPYLNVYDVVVFTMEEFLLTGLEVSRTEFIAPAIDPLSTKNMDIPDSLCREVIANAGVDTGRPLIVQVSRFDPWKDPMGVIESYRIARREISGLQLALVGSIAGDDPEGWQLLALVQKETADDDDIFVSTNLVGVGSMEVNAFQRACDLVVQKSLREGFGLVVSESLWKGTPVVAGNAGGIPMQFPEQFGQYLIKDTEECAQRITELLRNPQRRRDFGAAGREHVRRSYLLPRLLRDELRLIRDVLDDRGGLLTA